ncbi:MAG TPA: glycine cleavage system protein GcvH [Bacteroidetes bacterium]|nr:MAG: glycine cleavage system protein H [Ignavibacteria bacterium GWA2_54_16]HCA80639.1 glycine cleavage system protein GcvH [Bacteroidota bacterium]
MTFPENLKYTKDHEWMRIEGEFGWVGITDYAQGELGDVVFVELPAVGTKVQQGKSFGTIEAVKAVSDLYAPVSGEVVEINKDVQSAPDAVNKDPYGKGWMIKMKVGNAGEVGVLLNVDAYKKLVAK